MKNKLKILRDENHRLSQNLNEQDGEMIKRILNYLRTAKLCSYDASIFGMHSRQSIHQSSYFLGTRCQEAHGK